VRAHFDLSVIRRPAHATEFTIFLPERSRVSPSRPQDSPGRVGQVPWAGDDQEQPAHAVTPVSRALFLAGAGVLAGLVGTAGGITSLVSYPALLWAGVAPLQANVANIVALVACWPGSAATSRPELTGRGRWLRHWSIVAAAGGTAGSVLLLATPAGVFGRVVPFLVAAGSVVLLLQPRIAARSPRPAPRAGKVPSAPGADTVPSAPGADTVPSAPGADTVPPAPQAGAGRGSALLPCGLFALSVYNGYFGAGSGVLLLALLLLTTEPALARANALKNTLVGAATIISALLFAVLAPVDWTAVGPLAAGTFAGSLAGPWVARRMPPALLRWLVALTGLALAVRLWLSPAG
jgi:uncharacterized membrane protein YfcA